MKSRNTHAEKHIKGSLNTEGFDSFEHKPPLPSVSYDSVGCHAVVSN